MGFASIGKHKTTQDTIKVPLEDSTPDVIKVKVTNSTWQGNHCGFRVKVNDKKYYFPNTLHREEAFELGYVKYIKEER